MVIDPFKDGVRPYDRNERDYKGEEWGKFVAEYLGAFPMQETVAGYSYPESKDTPI